MSIAFRVIDFWKLHPDFFSSPHFVIVAVSLGWFSFPPLSIVRTLRCLFWTHTTQVSLFCPPEFPQYQPSTVNASLRSCPTNPLRTTRASLKPITFFIRLEGVGPISPRCTQCGTQVTPGRNCVAYVCARKHSRKGLSTTSMGDWFTEAWRDLRNRTHSLDLYSDMSISCVIMVAFQLVLYLVMWSSRRHQTSYQLALCTCKMHLCLYICNWFRGHAGVPSKSYYLPQTPIHAHTHVCQTACVNVRVHTR